MPMTEEKRPSLETIFHRALERTNPGERDAYLDGVCGADTELRARAESLLVAHDEASGFLDEPAVDSGRVQVQEGLGSRIGPYKLLQEIGEGGMGVVYMAEQETPVRRMVALKIIKLGMDTKQVIARFEAERQALALMDHSNIARVFDAGATETGRPYFVMELVRGVSIHEYCDKQQLSTRARLELFVDTCRAVQHAHQKGIIHRDIKPTNVLVTSHDGKPVVKIIDFGVAKATNRKLTEKTLFTEFRQFIGTPEYMSPEQAEMSGLDVDTRTDIYSLGVLLYQLLTGATPFDPVTLRDAGYSEMTRIIREEEPAAPSTHVSKLGDSLTELAKRRQTDPSALVKLFRGDLDWIVMMALEKDRTRRYDTASAMADDVCRHLADEPVLAGPPSTLYRLRKFIRRNRVPVMAGSLATSAVFLGLGIALIGLFQARQEARRSQRISETLTELLAVAGGVGDESLGRSRSELVEEARAVFGEDHATVAATLNAMAGQLHSAGNNADAEELYTQALDIWRQALGEEHANVGFALGRLGETQELQGNLEAAEVSLRESLRILRSLSDENPLETCHTLRKLADVLARSGEVTEAQSVLREALNLYRSSRVHVPFEVFATIDRLLQVQLTSSGSGDLSETFAELKASAEEAFPRGHYMLGLTEFGWGAHLYQYGKHAQGTTHLRRALEVFRGMDDPPTLQLVMTYDILFQILRFRSDSAGIREADDVLLAFLGVAKEAWGPEDRRYIMNVGAAAERLLEHDRGVEALPYAAEYVQLLTATGDLKRARTFAGELTSMIVDELLEEETSEPATEAVLAFVSTLKRVQVDHQRLKIIRLICLYRLGREDDPLAQLQALSEEPGDRTDAAELILVRAFEYFESSVQPTHH